MLSGEYPEQFVFGGEQCVPMMEYQWEDYVENLRKVDLFTENKYLITVIYCGVVNHFDALVE